MKRNNELDCLRTIACFLVIVIHVSADFVVDNIEQYNLQFTAGNLFDSLSRISVPLFVMLSGAFILGNNNNTNYELFYKKSFNKILIPTFIWGIFYTIFNAIYLPKLSLLQHFDFQYFSLVKGWFSGIPHYHLWYVFSTIGLYIITPILINLKNDIGEHKFFKLSILILILNIIIAANSSLYWMIEFSIYIGYFMLGYTLKHYSTNNKFNVKLSSFISILSILMIFVLTEYFAKYNLFNKTLYFYKYLSPLVAIGATFCFLTFLNIKMKYNYFENLSNHSFSIYLIHPLVLSFFQYYLLYFKIGVNAFWYIPLVAIIVFSISYFLSVIISKVTDTYFFRNIYRKIIFNTSHKL